MPANDGEGGASIGVVPEREHDVDFELMRTRLLGRMFGEAETPPILGRFELLEELGRGAMGTIYRARDPELDRDVALKLVHAEVASEAMTRRMLREAQGLAKLAHPNVVPVFEVGPAPMGVWIAMEYVPGQTLRDWLERPRSWRERLAVLVAAGRGLAAAHAVGLVHRDFKPDNVMIGDDGRARVLDFGLVRSIAHASTTESTTEGSREGSDPRTTASRSLGPAGTPAYMAPEAFQGTRVGPHTDQWAFCVTAYEALLGRRPFAGDTYVGLAMRVCNEPPAAFGRGSGVPVRVRDAIMRGLAKDPEARWPDMNSLLAVLDDALGGWRRTRIVGVSLGLATGLGVTALAWLHEPSPTLCELDASALAGVWDQAQRAKLRAGLGQREQELAASTIAAVESELERWSSAWLEGQRDACRATHVLGTASPRLLDLRTSCFQRQRREAGALVELLRNHGAEQLGRAPLLIRELPDPERCNAPGLSEVDEALPVEPSRREAVLTAQAELLRSFALAHFGRIDEAETIAAALAGEVAMLEHPPLALELRALEAEHLFVRRRDTEAVGSLRAVIREAEIVGLDELAATSWTRLVVHTEVDGGSLELRAANLDAAATAVARLGRADDPRELELELVRGGLLEGEGRLEAALEHYRGVTRTAKAAHDLVLAASAQRRAAQVLASMARPDEAEDELAKARTSFEAVWGPRSLISAEIEYDLALLEMQRGRIDPSAEGLVRARALLRPIVAADAVELARITHAEAKLAFMRGDFDAAAEGFASVVEHPGLDPLTSADAWEALGVIRFYRKDHQGSLVAYRRALNERLAVQGAAHPKVGVLHSNIGETLAAFGDHVGALSSYADALAILEATLSPEHLDLAYPYKGRGKSRLVLGDLGGALQDLQHALALHEANPGDALERADVESSLARALVEAGAPQRGLELARLAARRYTELGQTELADEIIEWIESP